MKVQVVGGSLAGGECPPRGSRCGDLSRRSTPALYHSAARGETPRRVAARRSSRQEREEALASVHRRVVDRGRVERPDPLPERAGGPDAEGLHHRVPVEGQLRRRERDPRGLLPREGLYVARAHPAAARVEDTSTAAQPITRAAADHPRWTEELDDIELTRLRTPVTGQPPVPPGLRLVFDTGERVDVLGEGVVGRAPQGDVEHVVAIDDPARSLSKTHLAFGPAEPGTLWVVDRGSTNSTLVVRPDGTAATLPAGTRASVGPGWSLRLGERTVRVEAR